VVEGVALPACDRTAGTTFVPVVVVSSDVVGQPITIRSETSADIRTAREREDKNRDMNEDLPGEP
jgi:hypothetical protein